MKKDLLKKYELIFPGQWIVSDDRDWASQNYRCLMLITDCFYEATVALYYFRPFSIDSIEAYERPSPYDAHLNTILAKHLVYSLDSIRNIINKLCKKCDPPPQVLPIYEEYKRRFGHLKFIRDSAIHIEDRSRGVNKNGLPLGANIISLSNFVNNTYCFTGDDGNEYGIDITEETIRQAHEILQKIVDSYGWHGITITIDF